MTNRNSPFITFEGGEGSGKSTQSAFLYQTLLKMDMDVVQLREPGGTKSGEEIRHLILKGEGDRWTPKAEALLMSAARAELVQKRILPYLEGGTWVICDRFMDSTMAYQGYGHKLGFESIDALNKFTVGNLEPDLTFIFQLSPELGLARTALREGGEDRYERFSLDFHRSVERGYKEVLEKNPHRCVAVNALLDINTLSRVIFNEVEKRFGLSATR
ncbi:MAG: dTMP kinase [Alphaproteobacteria bacterium]|nr:dTMP kinase [Alphaproteobacteria bacterium]